MPAVRGEICSPVLVDNRDNLDVVVGEDVERVAVDARVGVVLARVHHIRPQSEEVRVSLPALRAQG
jgi:hypothetical protein